MLHLSSERLSLSIHYGANVGQRYFGIDTRKLDFAECEQQRRRPACASAQSGQRLCFSFSGKFYDYTCYRENVDILTSLCS